MASSVSWWAGKVRQLRSHVRARVRADERAALVDWLTPAQLALFDSMHVADRRHGLDVVAQLRRDGVVDEDVLVAGLLHDAGKGQVGLGPRIVVSLAEAFGAWVTPIAASLPGFRRDLATLHAHAEHSAELAETAGCSRRTVELIRDQDAPRDPEFGELLRLADEAN
jgi:hypothetical protein